MREPLRREGSPLAGNSFGNSIKNLVMREFSRLVFLISFRTTFPPTPIPPGYHFRFSKLPSYRFDIMQGPISRLGWCSPADVGGPTGSLKKASPSLYLGYGGVVRGLKS